MKLMLRMILNMKMMPRFAKKTLIIDENLNFKQLINLQ